MPLLTNADYPAIRAALEATLPVGALPDVVIGYPIYLAAGMQDVLDRIPTAEALAAAQLARAQRAAIYYTAARLALTVPSVTRDQFAESSTQFDGASWDAKAAELRRLATIELDGILAVTAPSAEPETPPFFRVAKARRRF